MTMVVKNNIAAQLVLGELNKNSDRLRKSLEKVSSGQKINFAKDDGSGYVISEKMREQIRTLQQDNQNVQNGSSLFKIADGGINSIVEELRNLKELAINAANDTNTDIDRVTIQKEFKQKYANINDIATMTNYNGKTLLDGTYFRKQTTVTGSSTVSVDTQGARSPLPSDYTSVYREVTEPTGATTTISGTNYTISSDGVYEIAAGFTGTINVNATNVKIIQANPSTTLNDVRIVGPSSGNANLWIENLNINETSGASVVRLQGNNNVLTVAGDNSFRTSSGSGSNPVISVGNGGNIQGNGDNSLTLKRASQQVGIGGLSSSTNIGVVNLNLICDDNVKDCAIIGCYTGYIGNINIENSSIHSVSGLGVIGSNIVMPSPRVGNIKFISSQISNVWLIGSGGRVGDVEIQNSILTRSNGEIRIGFGASLDCGDIYISNSTVEAPKCTIGTTGNNAIDITLVNSTEIKGSTITVDANSYYGDVGNIYLSQSTIDLFSSSPTYIGDVHIIDDTESEETTYEQITTTTVETKYNALKIHHGPKANQATNFFINDMHTKSLGTEKLFSDDSSLSDYERILSEQDQDRYDALSYDEDLQNAWLETLKSAQNKTLDDISVTTKQNANIAIRVLDGAIEYALNEATQIGSYLQRLEYTDANITTMGENVQAAESTIRDADMAKEMTEYTKANVLTQAAQSMLAQANQNSSAVLSLLQ